VRWSPFLRDCLASTAPVALLVEVLPLAHEPPRQSQLQSVVGPLGGGDDRAEQLRDGQADGRDKRHTTSSIRPRWLVKSEARHSAVVDGDKRAASPGGMAAARWRRRRCPLRSFRLVWLLPARQLAGQAAPSDLRPTKSDAWDCCLARQLCQGLNQTSP